MRSRKPEAASSEWPSLGDFERRVCGLAGAHCNSCGQACQLAREGRKLQHAGRLIERKRIVVARPNSGDFKASALRASRLAYELGILQYRVLGCQYDGGAAAVLHGTANRAAVCTVSDRYRRRSRDDLHILAGYTPAVHFDRSKIARSTWSCRRKAIRSLRPAVGFGDCISA